MSSSLLAETDCRVPGVLCVEAVQRIAISDKALQLADFLQYAWATALPSHSAAVPQKIAKEPGRISGRNTKRLCVKVDRRRIRPVNEC